MRKRILIAALVLLLTCCSCKDTSKSSQEICLTNEILQSETVEEIKTSAVFDGSYAGPRELLEDAELVVLATSDVNRTYISIGDDPDNPEQKLIYNTTEFTIDKVLYGTTDETKITIRENGGVVTYGQYCDARGFECEESEKDIYVRYSTMNAPLIEDHQQYILFLREDVIDPDYYMPCGEFMGRYELNPWGGFSRDEPEPNFYPPTSTYINEDPDASSNPQFTLEQMIEICNEYQNTQ